MRPFARMLRARALARMLRARARIRIHAGQHAHRASIRIHAGQHAHRASMLIHAGQQAHTCRPACSTSEHADSASAYVPLEHADSASAYLPLELPLALHQRARAPPCLLELELELLLACSHCIRFLPARMLALHVLTSCIVTWHFIPSHVLTSCFVTWHCIPSLTPSPHLLHPDVHALGRRSSHLLCEVLGY